MSAASLTISIIAILIVVALAWNSAGGKDDTAALRKWWRGHGPRSPHQEGKGGDRSMSS